MRARLIRIGAFVTGFLIASYVLVSFAMAYQLTLGNHRPLGVTGGVVQVQFENIAFTSRVDHLTLRGWLYRSPSPSGRSLVVVHGKGQNRVNADFNAVGLAKDFLAHGFDVLLFDLRSCGTSEGDRFTLGNLEPRDLLGAYDFMRGRGYAANRMAILGDSEGAVTVIEAAKDLGQVGALVADNGFAALKPELDAQLPYNTWLPPIFYPGGELVAELWGFNPNLRPVDAVRALPNRAFLFFQGGADHYVPVANAYELRNASSNAESQLVIVPKADHVKSYRTNPALYLSTLYRFVDQQIAEHGG
ncbi:MAG TPA: alpha/beta hydrolase [Candidatus Dormibacteraeota bacterium]|nr:alpha/beta hydrolase [Candidatus Dormibacteraeota bacterium]